MKYCNSCGQQLPDEAAFCTNCGAASKTATDAPAANSPGPVSESTPGPAPESYPAQPMGGMAPPLGFGDAPLAVQAPPGKRRTWLWIAGGVILVVLLACALIYNVGNFSAPKTPKLAAADTEMFLCVKPNMFQVKNFNKIKDTYMAIPEVKDAVNKLKKEMQNENDIDFDKDVAPWLGKEAAVFMPKLDEQKVAFAVEYNSSSKVKDFLTKATRKQETHVETYNGTEVTTDGHEFYAALTGAYLVIASDEGLMHETIDRSKGKIKDNLSSNSEYQRIANSLPSDRSAFWYCDLRQVMSKSKGSSSFSELSQLKDLGKAVESLQSAGAAISLESNGVRGDYIIAFDKQGIPEYLKTDDKIKDELQATLDMMPEDTLGFVHSSNLVKIIKETLKNPGSSSELAQINRGINEMERETGINLQSDILDVMRGDAIMALTPQYGKFFGQTKVPVGMVFALGLQDQSKAQRSTDKFLSFLERNNLKVDRKNTNGSQIYNIAEPYGSDSLSMGIGNKLFVVASSPELTDMVFSKHSSALAKNADYKTAFGPFSGSWEPVLYMNATQASKVMADNLSGSDQEQYRKEVAPWIGPIKTISAAHAAWDKSKAVSQGAIFIRVEKP